MQRLTCVVRTSITSVICVMVFLRRKLELVPRRTHVNDDEVVGVDGDMSSNEVKPGMLCVVNSKSRSLLDHTGEDMGRRVYDGDVCVLLDDTLLRFPRCGTAGQKVNVCDVSQDAFGVYIPTPGRHVNVPVYVHCLTPVGDGYIYGACLTAC